MTKILTTVILLMLLHFGNNTSLLAQCSATQTQIIIQIFPDTYPQETSWVLATNGGTPLASHTLTTGQTAPVIDTVCLPQNTCIRFTILDTYGDGICCAFGNGHYYVIAGTDTLRSGGSFQRSEVTYIGCNSPGANCVNGLPVAASSIPITAPHTDMWYKFVADSTGNYTLSTCNLNTCNTRLWIYDYCLGLAADTTNQGTYAFNDNACNSNTAEIRTYMVAGNTYYIRVGETGSLCNGGSVVWTLLFNGPIVGCTDPNACTFNPLATVSDTAACLPIGDPNCPPMPDLKVLQPQIVNTLHLEYVNNADQCLVGEGCMAGYGQRELLRFDTHIENIGGADFYLGQPPANASLQNDQWRWDLCHNHWHYEGYAEYVFFDQNNQQIPVGRKNGFCVMDLDCATQGGIGKYNCSNQGITKQCGDIYASYLQCQWVDITAIQPGSYKFIVRVNWQQDRDITGRRESDYHNNWAQVCLNITRDSVGKAHFTVDPNCPNYTDCMGEAFGSAVPDCDGVCNGTRKKGDINSDGNRNISDLNWYLHQALNTTAPATNCTDLSGDGAFDLTDAGNLIDCILHPQGGIAPGHSH
ncbi:MAG: hypothetical protein RI894_2292, partial [Bacteroidota bacterium]